MTLQRESSLLDVGGGVLCRDVFFCLGVYLCQGLGFRVFRVYG